MAKILIWFSLIVSIGMWPGAVGEAAERYITRRGDTLWEIAERYVPEGAITTQEMMWELFDANPDAFIDDDINLLKIGYALRIPPREELRATLPALETSEARRAADPVAPPAPAAETQPDAPVEAVAAESSDVAPDIGAEDVAKLQNELAQTQAQATRQHAENEALRSRVAALEAQVMQLHDAAAPHTAEREGTLAWLSVPNLTAIVSAAVVLGFAAFWWRRREAVNTTAGATSQMLTEQPTTAAAEPLALSLDDVDVETEHAGEAAADAILTHLIIDVDDLELESSSGRDSTS